MPAGKWTLKEIVQGQPLGHPTHPMLVHFPTALYPAALLLGILARVQTEPAYGRAAVILIGFGLVTSILAAFLGFVDWFGMVAGSTKRRVATRHMLIQICAQVLAVVAFVTALFGDEIPSVATLALLAAAVAVLSLGNWFGGILVYRMGMRVNVRPATKVEAASREPADPLSA